MVDNEIVCNKVAISLYSFSSTTPELRNYIFLGRWHSYAHTVCYHITPWVSSGSLPHYICKNSSVFSSSVHIPPADFILTLFKNIKNLKVIYAWQMTIKRVKTTTQNFPCIFKNKCIVFRNKTPKLHCHYSEQN